MLAERIEAAAFEIARLQAAGEARTAPPRWRRERRVRSLERELAAAEQGGEEQLREQAAELERERERLVRERERAAGGACAGEVERTGRPRSACTRSAPGASWEKSWSEVRRVIAEGVQARPRDCLASTSASRRRTRWSITPSGVARGVIERALGEVGAAEEEQARSERGVSATRASADGAR